MAENELGAFLRARRESVSPARVGLPGGPRRRTPGLRRAELATLAGVSAEYLTRLEQGRDRHPSGEILSALADAMDMSADERVHLHRLVKANIGGACLAAIGEPAPDIRPTIQALLDRLDSTPAVVVTTWGDLLAYTRGFERLTAALGLLVGDPPNLARYVFTSDRAQSAFPDWERIASEQAAQLRSAAALGDPHAAFLVEELTITAGARFRKFYDAANALPSRVGVDRWAHPAAGELRLAYESLTFPGAGEERLIVHLPADETSELALAELSSLTNH
jgi:transcriptional regulator with XRE-family HTH domain